MQIGALDAGVGLCALGECLSRCIEGRLEGGEFLDLVLQVRFGSVMSQDKPDVGGADIEAIGYGVVHEVFERAEIRADARSDDGGNDGQVLDALGHEVRARGAFELVTNSLLEFFRGIRVARADGIAIHEVQQLDNADIFAFAAESRIDFFEGGEFGQGAGLSKKIGEGQGIAGFAWGFAFVRGSVGMRAAGVAGDEVPFEAGEPGHGAKIRFEIDSRVHIRVMAARRVLRAVDHARAAEDFDRDESAVFGDDFVNRFDGFVLPENGEGIGITGPSLAEAPGETYVQVEVFAGDFIVKVRGLGEVFQQFAEHFVERGDEAFFFGRIEGGVGCAKNGL